MRKEMVLALFLLVLIPCGNAVLQVCTEKMYMGTYPNGLVRVYDDSLWSTSFDSPEYAIWSLGFYNDELFAGTWDKGLIYKYDGCSWELSYDTHEKDVKGFEVYNGKLYAGTGSNGKIFVYDGVTWSLAYDSSEAYIYALKVYNGKLYAATGFNGKILVYNGVSWGTAYETGSGGVYSLEIYNNKLYAGTGTLGKIFVYDGSSWSLAYDSTEEWVFSLKTYNGKLYAGTNPNGKVFKFDGSSWSLAYDSPEDKVLALEVFNNKLYAATTVNGKVYVYDGSSWSLANDDSEQWLYSLKTACLLPCHYCGDGRIDIGIGEECELPDTLNNPYCDQSQTLCVDHKTKSRDVHGNCDSECSCTEDPFGPPLCIKGSCGAVCELGNTEARNCGLCGHQERRCTEDCQWGEWGECTHQGVCTPGQIQTRACGNCGTQQRTCTQECRWRDWSDCTGEGICKPGDISFSECGLCGYNYQTCLANCSWSELSSCLGEGICEPGATETQPCGRCGQRTRTCTQECGWGEWSVCGDEGVCDPGTLETKSCGLTDLGECEYGEREKVCNNECQWDAWSECNATYPTPEICDGLDNDCDGDIDEGLIELCGRGQCLGIKICSAGVWSDCSSLDLDCGICALCDENGDCTVYDDTQDEDCVNTTCLDSCFLIPDSNSLTLDYAPDVPNVCTGLFTCSENDCTYLHECDMINCRAECEEDKDCEDSTCSVKYYDFCIGRNLTEYDDDKVMDSTKIMNSCPNTCQEDCICTRCEPDCSPPPTNTYCVQGVCGAECDSNDDCGEHGVCLDNCMCEYRPYCGDGDIDSGEDCELPNTNNNAYCAQTIEDCSGNKLGARDARGDCDASCGCLEDPFTYECVQGECGAQCDGNEDCDDFDPNTVDVCNLDTCMCEHEGLPYCGDGSIGVGEECELPSTPNNMNCLQTQVDCEGYKLGTRDSYEDCDANCLCSEDLFTYSCVPGECGAVCEPGDTDTQSCGLCGHQERTCTEDCVWGEWGSCEDQGICEPGNVILNECGLCGINITICTQDCEWAETSECISQGTCEPGSVENRGCGMCGSQQRTCLESCGWSEWGECLGQGECMPGETQTESCGNCGERTRTCSQECGWQPWSECTHEGVCTPGSLTIDECGNCGVKLVWCGLDCEWNELLGCYGQGVCTPGETELMSCGPETDEGICEIGEQGKECLETCQWSDWSECEGAQYPQNEICNNLDDDCDGLVDEDLVWICGVTDEGECEYGEQICEEGVWSECDAVFPECEICFDLLDNDCDGEIDEDCGVCFPGETQEEECGWCGYRERVCLETGEWGEWEECLDEGECAPGGIQTQQCGETDVGECKFGLQTKICSEECYWEDWGECTGAIYPVTEICDNGLDDDCDGLIDEGCRENECDDGIDNDGDGRIDYPEDPGCKNAIDPTEYNEVEYECSDGIDNDGDGLIDDQDPGCYTSGSYSQRDNVEADRLPDCNDFFDNDGDGLIDYPNDPDCEDKYDKSEF